ncbi:TlpA family protein disulfide reductase [Methylotenera versatilis]|uniref:Redoxin domain protein n=1 Tax=Methylotenera versatilis (strain 301) TaxID=666681 RepID=D7DMA5_METV0|nr:TlpA disulfide reductase family protein [Methylotenera versatilis]ADI28816.1 Redoxin domain protein [Methylotenera versatilis 301]
MKLSILMFSVLLSISSNAFANTPGEVTIGSYLPIVTLNGFSGNTKKLSSYRGKPLIINVWASWCGPCREEISSLERLSRRFGGKQINVIGISTDDDASAAAAFIKDSKLTFTNYLDSHVQLENLLGANTIPLTILVDERGRVVEKVRGFQEWDNPETIKLINQKLHLKLK